MGRSKCGLIGCDRCGDRRPIDNFLSLTGLCGQCSEEVLRENEYGLRDPESVAYKKWKLAYRVSRPGRPGITLPSKGWLDWVIQYHNRLASRELQ